MSDSFPGCYGYYGKLNPAKFYKVKDKKGYIKSYMRCRKGCPFLKACMVVSRLPNIPNHPKEGGLGEK